MWLGSGEQPSHDDVERAVRVLSAVPLAAAAGWSVRGHPWTCHPRRLSTAVIRPDGDWEISIMRGVREVDCLSGAIIVRRRHIDSIELGRFGPGHSGPGDPVQVASRAMRNAGFRLLLLNAT